MTGSKDSAWHEKAARVGEEPPELQQLASITTATLTPLVRGALDSETAEVIEWGHDPVAGGTGFNAGIYRFSGTANVRGETARWSMILKSIRLIGGVVEEPADIRYWKCEPRAYESGLLEVLPGGLRAPRCFDVVESQDDCVWIWLEDIQEQSARDWSVDRYALAARHLGQINGAYLAGHPIPDEPWVSAGWLCAWVEDVAPGIAQLRNLPDRPLVRRGYPPGLVNDILRLWDQRDALCTALEGLPQTFCHLDAWCRNLFADGPDHTVAIDWAFVGKAPAGEEIAALLGGNLVVFQDVDVSLAPEHYQTVLAGYLDGLADAGWFGDEREIEFSYSVAGALRFVVGVTQCWITFISDDRHPFWDPIRAMGRSIEEYADREAQVFRFLLDRANANLGSL